MRIKKTILLCILVMSAYMICACENQSASKDKEEKETKVSISELSKYYYEYEHQKIYIAQKIEEAVEILGGNYEYFEAPSCASDGIDMFYYYQNFTVMANEINGEKLVAQIYFKNDTVATPEGIRITSSYADVVNQYGTDYDMNGTALEYSDGNTLLVIDVKDGKVAAIEYEYK